ncbi:hypothetical protein A3G65_03385 [Candidatus Roizmanbacteria bacterium RIFCSPLOWO2_12_FULL_37_7b]|nr:MAG: hypothetical protein A3G65_03385 [Candidatus Roizmanbacteria bacterium RIFCSPLOWO2_12_FULL_37_7b]
MVKDTKSIHGEVATVLTLIALLVTSIGLIIGYQATQYASSFQRNSQASEQFIPLPFNINLESILRSHVEEDDKNNNEPVITEPVNVHSEVCFPMGTRGNAVIDPYCRGRLYPNQLDDLIENGGSNVRAIFNRLGRDENNPNPAIVATTRGDQRTINIYGSVCLNDNSLGRSSVIPTEGTKIFLSTFSVRKYADEGGNIGVVPNDINTALEGLVASAEDKRGSAQDTLALVHEDQSVCTFTNGRDSYQNLGNPLIFNIQFSVSQLVEKIETIGGRSFRRPDRTFDTKECSVYVHLRYNGRGDGPKDTYNLIRIHLADLLEKPDLDRICPGASPTPTYTPTPTPSDTPTPTPTISVTPTDTPTPTITLTPTITSTPTITPTPEPRVCTFEALAFVQECTEWENEELAICKKDQKGHLIGKPVVLPQYSQNTQPPQHTLEFPLWSNTNNKSARSGKIIFYNNPPVSPKPLAGLLSGEPITATYYGTNNYNISPYLPGEDAHVSITIDGDRYNFLPSGGKEIRMCENKDIGLTGTDACNINAFEQNRSDVDTVHGLTINCGQDIVYGWTLQKCQQVFDYIFVVDTSTSMANFDDPFYGKRKIEVLKDNLTGFIDNISRSTVDNRVALIQFNKMSAVRSSFSRDFNGLQDIARNGLIVREGTCIECGIDEARNLILSRADTSRKPVVIILTDGLPNSNPGGAGPAEGYIPGVLRAANRLKSISDITIASIGYGDPLKAGSDIRELPRAQFYETIIKPIATDETWAFSTDTNRAQQAGTINEIYSKIGDLLNSCAVSRLNYARYVKSKDLNDDGIINSVDLLLIFEAYFQQGNNLSEDINGDDIVNSLDSSLIFLDYGQEIDLLLDK